jgi:thioredoxin-like negative regulator of GroEL
MEINEISEIEFETTVNSSEIVLVDCYADWCGPCHTQGEILHEECIELEKVFPTLKIFKLNTDEAQEISDRFGINSIPQLIVFYKGYSGIMKAGVKTIQDILQFIKDLITEYDKIADKAAYNKSKPLLDLNHAPMHPLDTENFDTFVTDCKLGFILFYNDSWPPAWIMSEVVKGGGNEFLDEFPELKFGLYNLAENDPIKARLNIQAVPQISIIIDGKMNFMAPGYRQLDEIAGFIHSVSDASEPIDERPLSYLKIIRVDGENWEKIHTENPFILLGFWQGQNRDSMRQLLIFQREQSLFLEKFPSLVFAYASADDSPDLMKKYGVSTVPTNLVFLNGAWGQMLPGEKSPVIIVRFIEVFQQFLQKANKSQLSKEKPAFIQPDLIHHISRAEFDPYIAGHEMVLVDFWAAWCGPCQTQGQILEFAAQDLLDEYPSLSIIKVNTDEDEGLSSERYEINAIPQIMLFYKNCYGFAPSGVMEPEEILSFLKEFLNMYEKSDSKTGCLIPLQKDDDSSDENEDSDEDDEDQ